MTDDITAIIVSFNRKQLLLRCLNAVCAQTRAPQHILIVDNASTDGTRVVLEEQGWLTRHDVEYLRLSTNVGGAGGFAVGMQHAAGEGARWLWTMDDDGLPEPDCLERLSDYALTHQLESLAPIHLDIAQPERLAFRTLDAHKREMDSPPALHGDQRDFVPNEVNLFNGWLVSATLLANLGLPRPELFIRGDEVEYAQRMRRAGARFGTLTSARFLHPSDRDERIRFLLGIGRVRDAGNAFKNYYMYRNKALAFRENRLWWLLPLDFSRYVYYFLIHKKGDGAGLRLWWRATRDGLAKRLGRHPDF